VVLAEHFPNKVALLDLYTQFGDIAAMMNVVPKYTLGDLVPVSKDLDTELIQNYITKHASGVHVLVSSVEPIPLDVITAECLDSVLYVLKRMYRYVIMDVPPILHPATLHVLAHSNVILLIANLFDLTTATDTKKLYDALQSEHISRDNIKLVLNRVSKVNRLHTADIEQMFDCSILAHIPNDGRLVNSVNQGIPLAMSDGASPLGRSFIRLAASITGSTDEVAAAQAASLKKRLFKSKKGK
jgi:pilus assembly protein CpaE